MEVCKTQYLDPRQAREEDYEDSDEPYLSRIVDLAGSDLTVHPECFISASRVLSVLNYDNRKPDVQCGGEHRFGGFEKVQRFYKDCVSSPDSQSPPQL